MRVTLRFTLGFSACWPSHDGDVLFFKLCVTWSIKPQSTRCKNIATNKNGFQWDAYRPLVGRIPAYTAQGGICPGGLPRDGVLPGGVSLRVSPWGCLPLVLRRGVYPSMQWGNPLPSGQTDICETHMIDHWGSVTFHTFTQCEHENIEHAEI